MGDHIDILSLSHSDQLALVAAILCPNEPNEALRRAFSLRQDFSNSLDRDDMANILAPRCVIDETGNKRHWDYRLVRLSCGDLSLRRVFYTNGVPTTMACAPVVMSFNSIEEANAVARMCATAICDPVLDVRGMGWEDME